MGSSLKVSEEPSSLTFPRTQSYDAPEFLDLAMATSQMQSISMMSDAASGQTAITAQSVKTVKTRITRESDEEVSDCYTSMDPPVMEHLQLSVKDAERTKSRQSVSPQRTHQSTETSTASGSSSIQYTETTDTSATSCASSSSFTETNSTATSSLASSGSSTESD